MKLKYYSGAQVTSIIENLPDKEYLEMLNAFAKEPSADVVEVVRCKECKHKYYDGNQIICQKLYWCDGNNFEPSAEDFCSYGERGEDE